MTEEDIFLALVVNNHNKSFEALWAMARELYAPYRIMVRKEELAIREEKLRCAVAKNTKITNVNLNL